MGNLSGTISSAPHAMTADRPGDLARFERLRDWTFGFYLVFLLAGGLSQLLTPGAESAPGGAGAQGNLVVQIIMLAVLTAAGTAAYGLGISLGQLWRRMWPLLPLVMIVTLSVAWAEFPDIALRRTVRFVIEIFIIVLLVEAYRDSSSLFRVATGAFILVVLADVALLAFPSISFSDTGYRGTHSHKNQTGSFLLLAFPFFLIRMRHRARMSFVGIGLVACSIVLLVLSQSKTSAAVCVASVALSTFLLFVLKLRGISRVLFIAFVAWLLALTSLLLTAADVYLDDLLALVIKDRTLTGRDQIWDFTLAHIERAPLLGLGYGSFWDTPLTTPEQLRRQAEYYAVIGQTHNGYLETIVQIGYVGMASVALAILIVIQKLWSMRIAPSDRKYLFVCVCVLVSFCLHNITETTLLRSGTDMWVAFLLVTLVVFKIVEQQPNKTHDRSPG